MSLRHMYIMHLSVIYILHIRILILLDMWHFKGRFINENEILLIKILKNGQEYKNRHILIL